MTTTPTLARRSFLSGLLVALAGCQATPSDPTDSSPPSTTAAPTPTSTSERTTITPAPGETTHTSYRETTGGSRTTATTEQVAGPVDGANCYLSRVTVESQQSAVGASARVYNADPRDRQVRIQFTLYDPSGTVRFQGTEWVRIPAGAERHVSRWWRRDRPGTNAPAIGSADVTIVAVAG